MKKKINVVNDCKNMFPAEIIDAILESRSVIDKEHFLNPTADDILPLDELKNIGKAAQIIIDAITDSKKILVWGDVDNDGASACAIMVRYLQGLNVECDWGVNDGKVHGTTDKLFKKVGDYKPDVLIIVDSLDANTDNYKLLHEQGLQVLVVDHHIVEPNIPYSDYICLVSSNVDYNNEHLCGAATTWKLCLKVDELLGTNEADMLVDLAMSGTISDMMDLSEKSIENRAIVKLGLDNVNNLALITMGKGFGYTSSTISYSVSPKVNAANRLNYNETPIQTLLSDDPKEVSQYVKKMDRYKDIQNKEIEEMLPDAIEQVESQEENKLLVVVSEGNSGINGVLANRIMNEYMKPTLVLKENYGSYSGSMRAPEFIDDFRQMCLDTGLCEMAGHASAAGVSINYNDFDAFREAIEKKLTDIEFVQTIDVDAEIGADDVNQQLIDAVKQVDRITGQGFKPLKFLIEINDYTVEKLSNGKHLGIRSGNMLFIKWNFNNDKLYEELEDAALCGDTIKCIGSLDGSFVYKVYNKMILDDIILD